MEIASRQQTTIEDVLQILLTHSEDFALIKRQLSNNASEMQTELSSIRQNVQLLNDKMESQNVFSNKMAVIKEENEHLKIEVGTQREVINPLQIKLKEIYDELDEEGNFNRKGNLIFFNIQPNGNKSTEELVADYVKGTLGCELRRKDVSVAFEMKSAEPIKPILVKFVALQKKEQILKAFRQHRRSHPLTNMHPKVGEQFTKRTKQVRKKLAPTYVQALREGKKAYFRYGMLYVDNNAIRAEDVEDPGDNDMNVSTSIPPTQTH
jgi:hypothetical protein